MLGFAFCNGENEKLLYFFKRSPLLHLTSEWWWCSLQLWWCNMTEIVLHKLRKHCIIVFNVVSWNVLISYENLQVLKLLGVKKQMGRYQPSDPRVHKRRLYGSLSSLPSSVSSRPIRDKRRHDQSERKKVKDLKVSKIILPTVKLRIRFSWMKH